jgi:hypothetical protein
MIVNIINSPRQGKRFRVYMSDGRYFDFGLDTGSTYIDHGDKKKRRAYILRHLGNSRERELIESLTPSPSLFSMKLLWGKHTDLNSNINELNRQFSKLRGGASPLTYKNKFNIKHGFPIDTAHSIDEISDITGYNLNGLQTIFNKGVGAYYSNPSSVRPNVKSPEQWAVARVYASLDPTSKAYKIDKSHLY